MKTQFMSGIVRCLVPSMLVGLVGCGGELSPDSSSETLGEVNQEVIPPSRVTFEKLLTCDGGAAYVDVNVEERRYLQLVVKDPAIMAHLHAAGATRLPFGATEATFRGFTGARLYEDHGPKLMSSNPYGGAGVFQASDFVHFVAEYSDFVPLGAPQFLVNIYRDGPGLTLVAGVIFREHCVEFAQGWDSSEPSCMKFQTYFEKRAEWHFLKCEPAAR